MDQEREIDRKGIEKITEAISPPTETHLCRRLILFLDGTWNEDQEDKPATNIVYLRERLYWGLQERLRNKEPLDEESFNRLPDTFRKKTASGIVFDGFEYIVHYERGVGTGPFLDRFNGGLFGSGLEQNIRRAYKFLSFWFRPGDEIFVFGFSRGAFTARSLCGYLHAVGLLKREHCTADNEGRAWSYYRTSPHDRLSGEWLSFREAPDRPDLSLVHNDRYMRVRILGVFDTVGALGIPDIHFRKFNRAEYEFHDTDVNSTVDIRLHALSIDEPRPEFEPALWTKPKFQNFRKKWTSTEQAWFPGAHSDVGGGYVRWNKGVLGLSHVPLAWMLQRINYYLRNTPVADEAPLPKTTVLPRRDAPIPFYTEDLFEHGEIAEKLRERFEQHKPRTPQSLFRKARRIINQIPLMDSHGVVAEGRVPYADPIGEMIHATSLWRLKDPKISVPKSSVLYRPQNLIDVLPYIASTYLAEHKINQQWQPFVGRIFSWKRILIVDWCGRPLDPHELKDVVRAFELLPTPGIVGIRQKPSEIRFMDEYITNAEKSGRSVAGF